MLASKAKRVPNDGFTIRDLKQAMKHTITKKGDDAFLSSFEVDGKRAFTETCTRLGPAK